MPYQLQSVARDIPGHAHPAKMLVIVSGLPASGKSTLARALADALGWPMLDKDLLLERLFDELSTGDAAWRTRLSRMADAELEKQAVAASNAVVASWWRHPRSASASGTAVEWLPSVRSSLVEVHCICSPAIAAARFIARTRHAGHLDAERSHEALLASFEAQAALGPLGIGRVVEVDTEGAMPSIAAVLRAMAPCGPSPPRGEWRFPLESA